MITAEELKLAVEHSPIIRFDKKEPFFPTKAGITFFYKTGKSASFPRIVYVSKNIYCIVEYAIWWDWDIQHLYELEHVWVAFDVNGRIAKVEGSWHGACREFYHWEEKDGHPIVYSQPGKHAFAANPAEFPKVSTVWACEFRAGSMGLLVKDMFASALKHLKTSDLDTAIKTHLKHYRFMPSFKFSREFVFTSDMFMSWDELKDYIPKRIQEITKTIFHN